MNNGRNPVEDEVSDSEDSFESDDQMTPAGSLVVVNFQLAKFGYFTITCKHTDDPDTLADEFIQSHKYAIAFKKQIIKVIKKRNK